MSLSIDVLFSGKNIQTLSSSSPIAVVVSIIADDSGKLVVTAQGLDQTSKKVGTPINGCPSPCHPGGGNLDCLNQTIELWQQQNGEQFF